VAEYKASDKHVKTVLPPAPATGQSSGYINVWKPLEPFSRVMKCSKFCYRTTLLKMCCTVSNAFAIQKRSDNFSNHWCVYIDLHKKRGSWIIMWKIWPMWRLRTAFLPKTFENVKTTPLYLLCNAHSLVNNTFFTTLFYDLWKEYC